MRFELSNLSGSYFTPRAVSPSHEPLKLTTVRSLAVGRERSGLQKFFNFSRSQVSWGEGRGFLTVVSVEGNQADWWERVGSQ
jgi:hypothetical protein